MLKKKKSVGNTREDIIFLKAIEHIQGMHDKKKSNRRFVCHRKNIVYGGETRLLI